MGWRFAVSTLGMPGAPLARSVRTAVAHGCEGLEIRAHPDEEVHCGMTSAAAARGLIGDAGLAIACLAGYAKVCAPGPDGPVIAELRALIDLAHELDASAVRVFPGGDGRPHDRIAAVLDDLRAAGTRLLVETHDSHPTGAAARRIVEPIGAPDAVAVLWDALHPWRHGESPIRTREVLGDYLGYFQLKDARAVDPTPLPPGDGEVPLGECAAVLRPWSGWVSLEWEKAWYPAVQPVGTALRAASRWLLTHRP
ncbi:sugar phosphate isomerase/epimerase family protein [Kutzneria kofuensis]|uniref:Sugar phosphate isomerase/epimerase n=1 Tax=Kutzneria kofuensis TaxID=103725 RepID=A0A7W9NLX8_9PSEU|nr:sugar phosphate isomerase/epimerase family protein [Kutzneria kofuensis]MBB5896946.1 sugar phosphate isomerase/epimerase [Kutzneria kofuensis]